MQKPPGFVFDSFIKAFSPPQLVSIDETKVVQNVPDMLAGSIPRVLLVSQSSTDVALINRKHWTHEQVPMFPQILLSFDDDDDDKRETAIVL